MNVLSRIADGATLVVRLMLLVAVVTLLGLAAVEVVAAADPSGSPSPASPSTLPSPGALPSALPSASDLPSPGALPSASDLPSPGASLTVTPQNTCVTCHIAIDNTQHEIATDWQASVHGQNGIACESCHGGDPTSDQVTVAMSKEAGFIGKPDRTTSVQVCGTCHANVESMAQYQIPTDQLAKYESSVHGVRLLTYKDTRVAICIDCHGVHDIKKASDPTAAVSPLNVPALCSSCHSDIKLMEPYGIPTDQFSQYQTSVHGQALLVKEDVRAPTCASCHGSHDAKPPKSSQVTDVCGKCHTATQALYEQALHSTLAVGPKCWTCHGTHDVVQPDESRFFHEEPPQLDCTTCHNPGDRTLILNANKFDNDADRRCDTCHHPGSIIYSQIQGIHDTLVGADTAYQSAAAAIAEAAAAGMIVSDADVTLAQAKTNLIRARAENHTTKLSVVAASADESKAKSAEAEAFANAKIQESEARRQAMVIVLAMIMVNIVALFLLRRGLHHGDEQA